MEIYTHVIDLTRIANGTRRKWPWSKLNIGDRVDVYGNLRWRRHAAASAGGFTYEEPHAKLRSKTLYLPDGEPFLRVTAYDSRDRVDSGADMQVYATDDFGSRALTEKLVLARAAVRAAAEQYSDVSKEWVEYHSPEATYHRQEEHTPRPSAVVIPDSDPRPKQGRGFRLPAGMTLGKPRTA